MEQQLQAEIKKNKNLLQSNFTLMQQNELCIAALTKLKKFISQNINQDGEEQYTEQTICAEDSDSFVNTIIQKLIKIRQKYEQIKVQKTEVKNINKSNTMSNGRQCECQKWKDLYVKQSEQSYRLSKKIAQLQQNISKIQSKHELQCKQMDWLFKQYLILFKKVNSTQYMQNLDLHQNKKTKDKQINKVQTNKVLQKKEKQKDKRQQRKSVGKSKSNSKSQHKKWKNNPELLKNNQQKIVPPQVLDELNDFPHLANYLQNLRKDCNNYLLQNKCLRKQITDAETIIRIYRSKERQRILYGQFLVN